MPLCLAFAALLAGIVPSGWALAHDGTPERSGEIGEALQAWSFDAPGVVLTCLIAGLYFWGYRRLRRDAPRFHFPRAHAWSFGAGIALLLLMLVSPIDTYSDDLFWVHMIQHMVVVMLIAPLLLLGAPATLALRAASPRIRSTYLVPLLNSRLAAFFTNGAVALIIFVASIWIWHIPTLYDAALGSEGLHFLEHSSFLGGALLFWWLIIGVDATRLRPGYIGRIAILILALIQNLGLALIIASAGDPIYDTYEELAALREWGPTAILDQRIGGGIMWVPGAMMLALAVLVTVYYWAEHEGFEGRRGDMVRALEKRGDGSAPDRTTEGMRGA